MQKLVSRRSLYWFIINFLIFCFALLGTNRAAFSETDISDLAKLNYYRARRPSRATAAFNVEIENISNDVIQKPLKVVITNISPDSVTVNNPDGFTEDGKPYFSYDEQLPREELPPGSVTGIKTWIFNNPSGVRFRFDTKILGEVQSYAAGIAPEDITEDPDTGIEIARNQIIVMFNENISDTQATSIINSYGCEVIGKIVSIKCYQVRIPEGVSLYDKIEEFKADPNVKSAYPNAVAYPQIEPPNDPWYGMQSDYTDIIKLLEAWDITKGSEEIKIGIIDDGLDRRIEDLDVKADEGYNLEDGSSDVTPEIPIESHYHGTAVAGILAARPDDNYGFAGVAWNPRIVPIKQCLLLSAFSISAGIEETAKRKCKVVNLSVGTWLLSAWVTHIEDVIKEVQDEVLIVAGCANDSFYNYIGGFYPAAFADRYPNVIAVAATDSNDKFHAGYGVSKITVAAPGVNLPVYCTCDICPLPDHCWGTGCSLATPQVAGLAALIWSLDYEQDGDFDLSPGDVKEIIKSTADPVPGHDFGRINAYRALVETQMRIGGRYEYWFPWASNETWWPNQQQGSAINVLCSEPGTLVFVDENFNGVWDNGETYLDCPVGIPNPDRPFRGTTLAWDVNPPSGYGVKVVSNHPISCWYIRRNNNWGVFDDEMLMYSPPPLGTHFIVPFNGTVTCIATQDNTTITTPVGTHTLSVGQTITFEGSPGDQIQSDAPIAVSLHTVDRSNMDKTLACGIYPTSYFGTEFYVMNKFTTNYPGNYDYRKLHIVYSDGTYETRDPTGPPSDIPSTTHIVLSKPGFIYYRFDVADTYGRHFTYAYPIPPANALGTDYICGGSIISTADNNTIHIDSDYDGNFDQTITLNAGETYNLPYREWSTSGYNNLQTRKNLGRLRSDKPIFVFWLGIVSDPRDDACMARIINPKKPDSSIFKAPYSGATGTSSGELCSHSEDKDTGIIQIKAESITSILARDISSSTSCIYQYFKCPQTGKYRISFRFRLNGEAGCRIVQYSDIISGLGLAKIEVKLIGTIVRTTEIFEIVGKKEKTIYTETIQILPFNIIRQFNDESYVLTISDVYMFANNIYRLVAEISLLTDTSSSGLCESHAIAFFKQGAFNWWDEIHPVDGYVKLEEIIVQPQ